jgi:hypothetical protein
MRAPHLAILGIASLAALLAGCDSAAKPQDAAANPVAQLQAIPPADSAKYANLRDMRGWQNPYLIIRKDGVALLDPADSLEIILKPDEVLTRLAQLPPSAWPYGRVVAVRENSAQNADDGVAIRRNRGLLAGSLDEAQVLIRWVPSA